MWIKRKQFLRRSLTAKSKPNYSSWRNCAIYQGYNKKAKQTTEKTQNIVTTDEKIKQKKQSVHNPTATIFY